MNYDFSTLNDKDLEELALDLLNAELNLGLQSFKVGKDGGIDLRYSSPENNNEIVVQVKHYLKSGESKLIKDFKENELPKLNKLSPSPTRYIIVASIGLSATQKDDLKNTFNPYIQSSNDILGKEDLNALLRKHKEVEKKHFKLWFSSSEVLTSILNNAIEGRSRSYLSRIRNQIPLYVLTDSFDKSNTILEKEKLLVITGMPGIGKTTLANVLLIEKARQQYKVYLINNIREAEDVISQNFNEKQVFYFDDFLGEVYYEILTGSQKENEIAQFIDRIIIEPNKFLILSTRTVILEQARNKSEKIKRARLETAKYEVELSNYSNFEKAKILYNHLYFGELDEKYIFEIIKDKFYNKIIHHKNYTPRIIEFLTDNYRLKTVAIDEYKEFILKNLNHPEEIWNDSINNQISYLDKCFLYTLFTFRNTTVFNIADVRRSFDKRLLYETEVNKQSIKTNQFDESIKNLLNGFIYIEMSGVDFKFEKIRFINPSISDFLLGNLKKNEKEKIAILNSLMFIEQIELFYDVKTGVSLSNDQQKILLEKIGSNLLESLFPWNKPIEPFYMEAIVKFCSEINYDDIMVKILNEIDMEETIQHKREFIYAINNLKNAPQSIDNIKTGFEKIIKNLLTDLYDSKLAVLIPDVFIKYGINYQDYVKTEEGNSKITDLIFNVIEKSEKDLFNSNKDSLTKSNELDEFIYEELDGIKSNLIERLNPGLMLDIPRQITSEEVTEQIKINHENEVKSEQRVQDLSKYFENDIQNEIENIESLFHIESQLNPNNDNDLTDIL